MRLDRQGGAVPQFLFEDHILDIEKCELRRGSEQVKLEPQVFDLIAYLVQNCDRVLSKDDLITAVWGGRIVSDSTLTSRINFARKAIGDTGDEQRLIRTYARKGFRFVGQVQETTDSLPTDPHAQQVFTPSSGARGKPCIAVLPFDNLSSDPEQEYFSDGVSEDIIVALAKHRSLLVVARSSTFALKRQRGDVRHIGRDLGANYLVQGSVRRIGPRMRITAQLVETESGQQIWTEQYDRQLEDIFEVQGEIAATVAARIVPEIGNAEWALAEQKPLHAFEAWDFFHLGTKHFYKWTADDNREAQRLFRRAIDIDPLLAQAYGFLSYSIVLNMIYFDAEPDDHLLNEAVEIAKRGAALDERDALIRFMYGRALLARKSYDEALGELKIAADLNPNLAVVYCGLGDSLAYEGRIDEAIPHFERAINLSPHDPLRWAFYSYRALAHLFARDFDLAEQWARRATRVPNCHYWGYSHRVAALGHLQRPDYLRAAVDDLRRVNPDFTCKAARRHLFYLKDPKQIALYIEGLDRAGVPEG
jgi:TolB-like protein/Tfp pilus assembly protein PilF